MGGAIDRFFGYHPTWFADDLLQLEVIPAFYIRKPDALWGTLGIADLKLKLFFPSLSLSQTFHHLTSFCNIFTCFKSKWRKAVMTVSTTSCVFGLKTKFHIALQPWKCWRSWPHYQVLWSSVLFQSQLNEFPQSLQSIMHTRKLPNTRTHC